VSNLSSSFGASALALLAHCITQKSCKPANFMFPSELKNFAPSLSRHSHHNDRQGYGRTRHCSAGTPGRVTTSLPVPCPACHGSRSDYSQNEHLQEQASCRIVCIAEDGIRQRGTITACMKTHMPTALTVSYSTSRRIGTRRFEWVLR